MKIITKIQLKRADHNVVIDNAATEVGRMANKAFLFFIRKEIQGWKNLTTLISWALSKVGEKHGPIFDEVKGRTVAVYRKGCQQETAFVQGLIKTQLTDRIDSRWQQHDKAFAWFKAQTQAFLADSPVKDTAEVKAEDQAPGVTEELEQAVPVAEAEEPSITILDESPVPVLDPPVEPADPLDDELSIPEDPAPVPVATGSKRKTGSKSKRTPLGAMMLNQAKTGKPS